MSGGGFIIWRSALKRDQAIIHDTSPLPRYTEQHRGAVQSNLPREAQQRQGLLPGSRLVFSNRPEGTIRRLPIGFCYRP
jgi:hypothetical protein